MKLSFRNISSLVCATLAVAALVYGLLEKDKASAEVRCKGIIVEVPDSAKNKFLDSKEVVKLVDRDFGGYVNRPAASINLQEMENVLEENGFIENCEAVMYKDGTLRLSVWQCSPVLRFVRDSTHIEYMDARGGCYAVQKDWCHKLKSASGTLQRDDREWMRSLAGLAVKIDADPKMSCLVSSIYCTSGKEIHLSLKDRTEIFDLGTPEGVEEKLTAVKTYLDKVASAEKQYEKVTVKYKGQIVCK